MRKNILTTKFIKMSFAGCCLALSTLGMSQNTGDFKSVQSGDWSSPSTWNVYDGAIWNTTTSFPDASSEADAPDVYLEASHTITLSSNQACGSLFLNGTNDTVRLHTNSNTLSVWGKFGLYDGAAPGSYYNDGSNPSYKSFIRTAYDGSITFKGSTSREIVEENAFGANSVNRGWNMAIEFPNTDTAFINSNMRMSNFDLTSGIVQVKGIKSFRPTGQVDSLIDGSNDNGWLRVESGATFIVSQLFSGGSRAFDSLIVKEGATIEFMGSSNLVAAATWYYIDGTLKLSGNTYPTVNADNTTSKRPTNLLLDTVGTLILNNPTLSSLDLEHNVYVKNKLSRYNASFNANGFEINYADDAVVEYAGSTDMTTGIELDNANNITLNTSAQINLSSDIELSNELTLTNGLLYLNDFNLILGENSPAVDGTPSSTSMVVTSGSGTLQKIFGSTGSYTFPIGDTTGGTQYAPIQLTLNGTSTLDNSTYLSAYTSNSNHPAAASQTNKLNRYWIVETNISSGIDISGIGFYNESDIAGDETLLGSYLFSDGTITSDITSSDGVDNSLNKVSFSGVNTSSIYISSYESTTGIENTIDVDINIGPNPIAESISITSDTKILSIEVVSITGVHSIISEDVNANSIVIEANKIENGINTLLINTEEGVVQRRIIKN